jgi:hypothetical protein
MCSAVVELSLVLFQADCGSTANASRLKLFHCFCCSCIILCGFRRRMSGNCRLILQTERNLAFLQDLCSRGPNGTAVDKGTFLKVFPLPGLLGGKFLTKSSSKILWKRNTLNLSEQLFKVFDQDHEDALTYSSFLIGLAAVCRGSNDERADFLFGMFDLRK